jgi:myo-inositol-hexaphosphate 3-phosphohydrolase
MIRLLLIFLLPLALNASKILSYNIYDRTDRADVMITFDTPYEGVIKQNVSKSQIIIKLTDAKIESSKLKKLSSKFLNSISITPMSGYTQIVASVADSVTLKASKTSDSYGLRLRFSSKVPAQTKTSSFDVVGICWLLAC